MVCVAAIVTLTLADKGTDATALRPILEVPILSPQPVAAPSSLRSSLASFWPKSLVEPGV